MGPKKPWPIGKRWKFLQILNIFVYLFPFTTHFIFSASWLMSYKSKAKQQAKEIHTDHTDRWLRLSNRWPANHLPIPSTRHNFFVWDNGQGLEPRARLSKSPSIERIVSQPFFLVQHVPINSIPVRKTSSTSSLDILPPSLYAGEEKKWKKPFCSLRSERKLLQTILNFQTQGCVIFSIYFRLVLAIFFKNRPTN